MVGEDGLLKEISKLAGIFRHIGYIGGLRFGVAAASEHEPVLRQFNCRADFFFETWHVKP